MHKFCMVLAASSTLLCESAEAVNDKDQVDVAAHDPVTVSRLDDTTSGAHRILESEGSTVSFPDQTRRKNEERVLPLSFILSKLERLHHNVDGLLNGRPWAHGDRLAVQEARDQRPRQATGEVRFADIAREADPQREFDRLTALRNADEVNVFKREIALAYNKLAEEISSAPDIVASGWMAKKWRAEKIVPLKVANMLGIDWGESLKNRQYSVVQWLYYIQLLERENSIHAIHIKEARKMLFEGMTNKEITRFLDAIKEPDLEDLVKRLYPRTRQKLRRKRKHRGKRRWT
uniref:RXLR effector n=1 Tax=Peronospora matthiolae TaxID=2874970 RepID=A0AAV1TMW2_9STRA